MKSHLRIGIDLGGTKIEGVVLSPEGHELLRRRIPTPRESAQAIVQAVASLVFDLERAAGDRALIGIGTPGSISPKTGLLRNSNTTALNGTPLRQMLEEAIGRPIRIENDANCFALSEAIDGAAKNARVVFGVIVGTGTGGGIVVNRRIWPGPNRIAGEWGHNPLPWPYPEELPGPPCYCGKRGCIETWLSGPALARDHAEFLSAQGHGPPRAPSPPEIAAQAQAGDPLAKATLERYAKRMARALASVINILDPDVIVLGGGLSQIPSLYPLVQKELPKWVFSDHVDVALLPPLHGDASGVRGAAWLSSDENDHLSLAPPLRLDDQSASGQGGF